MNLIETLPGAEPYTSWEAGLRARCRKARQNAGVSLQALDKLGMAEATTVAIESGRSRNVYVDQVALIARATGCSMGALVLGVLGRVDPDGTEAAQNIRRAMRAARTAAGASNDALNLATGQNASSRAITRIESGELQRVDLLRTWRVCHALGQDYAQWIHPSA